MNSKKKANPNRTLNLWLRKCFSFCLAHHAQTAVPSAPKLVSVCDFFVPGLFFSCSICNMHSHDGQWERFHKSQVVQTPRKKGHYDLGSLGGSFQVVLSRNCRRVWENSHCWPICSAFNAGYIALHVSKLNHQVQSHVFTRQFEHLNGPQRGMAETQTKPHQNQSWNCHPQIKSHFPLCFGQSIRTADWEQEAWSDSGYQAILTYPKW